MHRWVPCIGYAAPDGIAYEVDAALVGETVVLATTPRAPGISASQIWHRGERAAGSAC